VSNVTASIDEAENAFLHDGEESLVAHFYWIAVVQPIEREVVDSMYWYEQPKEARQSWVLLQSWLTYLQVFMNYTPPVVEFDR
jgi:hypothetical protein